MGYRTKIKHLSESNVKMAEDGELLVSSTSGHLSVKGPRGVVSRTKDLEARLASVNCVVETLQSILDTANNKTIADLVHIKNEEVIDNIIGDIAATFKELGITFKGFKDDIDAKYTTIKEMDEILENLGTFIRVQNRDTKTMRDLNDEHSIEIRDLEDLFMDKICKKLNNIQHYYYKHEVDMMYLENAIKYVKTKKDEVYDKAKDQLDSYMRVEKDLFESSKKDSEDSEDSIKLLNIYHDVYLKDFNIEADEYVYDYGYKLCKSTAKGALLVIRDGKGVTPNNKQILESDVIGVATIWEVIKNKNENEIKEKDEPVYVKRYDTANPGYEKCRKNDSGALKVINSDPEDNTDGQISLDKSDVKDVANIGDYVREVRPVPEIKVSMSYDEFVDKAIGFIFNKHDIAYYTPYTPANKR